MNHKRSNSTGKKVTFCQLRDQSAGLFSELRSTNFKNFAKGYACITMENALLRSQLNTQTLRHYFIILKTKLQRYGNQQQISRYSVFQQTSPIQSLNISSFKSDRQREISKEETFNRNLILVEFFYILREKNKLRLKQFFEILKNYNQCILNSKVQYSYDQTQKKRILKRLADLPRKKLKQSFMHFHFKIFGKKYLEQTVNRLVLYTNINNTSAFYRMLSSIRKPKIKYERNHYAIAIRLLINIFNKNISHAFTAIENHLTRQNLIEQQKDHSITQSLSENQEVFQKCQKVERMFQILNQSICKLGTKNIFQKKEDIQIVNAIIQIAANLRVNQRICFGFWRKHTTNKNIVVQTEKLSDFIIDAEQRSALEFGRKHLFYGCFQKTQEEGDTRLQETRIFQQNQDAEQIQIVKNDQ